LKEQLEPVEPGFYTLKESIRKEFDAKIALTEELPTPSGGASGCRFVLTGEISTIYKKGDKTRKVHHVVILPDFNAAETFQRLLERVGNIRSDGRPIVGIDSRDLLRVLLDADERALLIPAHIWTPWFSALGAKSGFDSIDECYGDLAPLIPAIETGLSSNPPMNWALSNLDRFSIISNSDAHSPEKLGREATVFEMDASFASLSNALHLAVHGENVARKEDVISTIGLYPQEGKYHYAGHRKCGVSIAPEEATSSSGICPRCGKALTGGVMNRVLELADRPVDEWGLCPSSYHHTNKRPYVSLIPLRELLGELLNTGSASKKVDVAYKALIEKIEKIERAGGEIGVLMDMPIERIEKLSAPSISGELLAQAVSRMRAGQVGIQAGYDGAYGVIRVFPPKAAAVSGARDSDGGGLFGPEDGVEEAAAEPPVQKPTATGRLARVETIAACPPFSPFSPDAEQEQAIAYTGRRALVIAGPGAGKTATLAARIARLVQNGADPASILALTFTVKAATELRERIKKTITNNAAKASGDSERLTEDSERMTVHREHVIVDAGAHITAATFHALCASILKERSGEHEEIPKDFKIIDAVERDALLQDICKEGGGRIKAQGLGKYIDARKRFLLLPGEETPLSFMPDDTEAAAMSASEFGVTGIDPEKDALYRAYQERLGSAFDFDDLVTVTVRLLAALEREFQEERKGGLLNRMKAIKVIMAREGAIIEA
jgi:uncharacterized protein (TIGR00375 family)